MSDIERQLRKISQRTSKIKDFQVRDFNQENKNILETWKLNICAYDGVDC